MKLHKTGKMVRILSMVLVVAIMMSVCLVQAFAASSRTETIGGHSATAMVARNSSYRAYGVTTYDVSAIVKMELSGHYSTSSGVQCAISGIGSANHYEVMVYGNERPSAAYSRCFVRGYGSVYDIPIGEVTANYT